MRAFGWKLQHVYSKDWLEQPERVLEKIKQKLEGKEEELEELGELESELELKENEVDSVEEIKPNNESLNTSKPTVHETELEPEKEQKPQGNLTFKRYEFVEGSSSKYWEIAIDGFDIVTRYGRIGNQPQENRKSMDDRVSVLKEEMRLIGVKTRKGYRPV
ncbi:superfamily I DNA and RNA helicases and helicase subunits [Nonlabens ulvanivorans]|nr:superfamily I DNA and RNA helicases and helicase subunits [Nonlabens ulvanivorans]